MRDDNTVVLKEIPWPYNLIELLSGSYAAGDDETGYSGELDFTAKSVLRLAHETLTPRELDVLETRYKGTVKTLKETGEIFGVQAERIRQIEAKAIRKMLFHARKYACVPWTDWKIERNARVLAEDREKAANDRLNLLLLHMDHTVRPGCEQTLIDNGVLHKDKVPLEELDLSVRCFNCLKRYGYNFLEEVVAIESKEDLLRIRNFGMKNMDEIIEKAHSFGYKMVWEQ